MSLRFAHASTGRTWLARQHAAYPFHVGRCLSISGDPDGMASVYLQCCSGGLFEDDNLRLSIEADPGALAHVRTSAATIVHSMHGAQAAQTVSLSAHGDCYLEYLPEALIMFPASHLKSVVEVKLHAHATVLASEMLLAHDPQGEARPFGGFSTSLTVRSTSGAILLRDRAMLTGELLAQRCSGVTGAFAAQATLFVLRSKGSPQRLLDCVRAAVAQSPQLYCGASQLPNNCGVLVRALSSDEPLLRSTLHAVRDAVRTLCFETGTVTSVPIANAAARPAG